MTEFSGVMFQKHHLRENEEIREGAKMTPGEEGIYVAREDDRRRARRFTRRLRNQPMTITYDVIHPSELGAGLRGYEEIVTVTVDSGDPGGSPNEFAEEMQKFLAEWFDGAAVGLRPKNIKPNVYPTAHKGQIIYVSVPED